MFKTMQKIFVAEGYGMIIIKRTTSVKVTRPVSFVYYRIREQF